MNAKVMGCIVGLFVLLLSSVLANAYISPPTPMSVHLIPKMTDCYASLPPLSGSFVAGNACDNSTGTQYLDDGSSFPVYLAFNLSKKYVVDHIAVDWGNYPGTGHVDVWTGSTWVAYVNFTGTAQNTNQTITLDHQYATQKVRLYAASSAVAASFFGAFEVWFYGDNVPIVPPTVSSVAATSVTSSSATIHGNLTAMGDSTTITVGFLYGTSPSLSGATNSTVGTTSVIETFSKALSSLTGNTTYYFRAWANGLAYARGSILNFTALPVAPSVLTLDASNITSVQADLNGNLTSLGTYASVTVGFVYGVDPTFAIASNVTVGEKTSIGKFLVSINGLDNGTRYYFRAWAKGSSFVNAPAGKTFRTPAIVPASIWPLAFVLFVFILTLILGFILHPAIHILCGIIGILLAVLSLTYSNDLVVAAAIIAVSFIILVTGIFRRP